MNKLINSKLFASSNKWSRLTQLRRLSTLDQNASALLDYWFNPGKSMEVKNKIWFQGGSALDKDIQEKFGDLVMKARSGELKHWEEHPQSALAHVILLDQFCRNIFRGKPESFSHDHIALRIAKELVSRGKDGHRMLAAEERSFVYLPFEHSENLEDQVQSVQLFTELHLDTSGQDFHKYTQGYLEYAKQHKEVIEVFGRFPRRNSVLGRTNTSKEDEFLANNPYHF